MTDRASARGLGIGVALGAPTIGWAVWDAISDSGRTKPIELALWIGGVIVVVDLIVLPTALSVGRIVKRPVSRWGLAATATVTAVAWPYIRGYGRNPNNPSLLSRNYGAGTLVALTLIWVAALAWLGAGRWRRLRQDSTRVPRPRR